MEGIVYASGPAGRYLYNAPKQWAWGNLPQEIADKLAAKGISDIKWAAFGDSTEKYFMLYSPAGDPSQRGFFYGDGNPASLNEWLIEKTADGTYARDMTELKVVFGQGNTFFAWDSRSVRWEGLSDAFQTTLQRWLSPAGWKFGPPRIVALGVSGSFLVVSEYGIVGYSLSALMADFSEQVLAIEAMEKIGWEDVENISLNPTNANMWFIVFKSSWTVGRPSNQAAYEKVAYSYATDPTMKIYREEKAAAEAEEAKQKKDAEEKRKKEQQEARARQQAEYERKTKAAREARDNDLRLQYAIWLSTCSASQSNKQPLTTFPYLPVDACTCAIGSCKSRKEHTSLLACRHDVESLLRASGNYSLAWLRTERLSWHPDRFGRRCHPDHKDRLIKKCTEMYAIYEELISLEQKPQAAAS